VGTPIVGAAHKKKNKMPVPYPALKLQRLPANTVGRDFVVGDIHGCLGYLNTSLILLGFNKETDRLISVGDLIDRGPFSKECAELIYEPWFYAVKGNHEDMMINTLVHNSYSDKMTWLGNGGAWMHKEDRTLLTDLATDLEKLPLVIVVGEGEDRYNVVHAEIKHWVQENGHNRRVKVTDKMIDRWVFDENEEYEMMWGRTIISNGHPTFPPPEHQLWHDMDEMSITFVGHTPIRDTVFVQRQLYIDNGAVFNWTSSNKSHDNKLVFASPQEKCVYQFNTATEQMTRVEFANIQQLS
jgi:serine/threonine protein phosphatase 1